MFRDLGDVLIVTVLMLLASYGGSLVTLQKFESKHTIIVMPASDGKAVLNDTDAKRAKAKVKTKKVQ